MQQYPQLGETPPLTQRGQVSSRLMGIDAAVLPRDEAARLQLLYRLNVLDSANEREFDDIVFMASMVCGCPMATISFVAEDRLWNKALVGPARKEIPRAEALGAVAITTLQPTIVADTATDPRVQHMQHGPVRLYAGFPLRTSIDPTLTSAVGVLAVMDDRPRALNPAQLEALAALARQTERLLELRVALSDARAEHETVMLSEERFRLAINGLRQGVLVTDRDGTIVSVNPAAACILGFTVDEMVGANAIRPTFPVVDVDGERLTEERSPIHIALRDKSTVDVPLMRCTLRDDTHRWINVTATPFLDPGTRQPGAVVSFLDITEEYELDLQLRDSLARLTAASRERAALISAVAHDLRAPVASMRLMADLLDDPKGALTVERRRDLLARLRLEAATTESALGDLVAADRVAGGLLAPRRSMVDVRALVRRRVDLVSSESHRLELHLPEQDLVLWADRAQLERVIDNLIGNGLKHTPAGSRLVVTAEDRDDVIAVLVDDDGPGVPDAARAKIFNAYTRGSDATNRPGSGIGLYLVTEFARFHGGTATLHTSPLGGAQFVVTFAKASGMDDEPAGLAG